MRSEAEIRERLLRLEARCIHERKALSAGHTWVLLDIVRTSHSIQLLREILGEPSEVTGFLANLKDSEELGAIVAELRLTPPVSPR
jgi:hypothetical protein